MDIAPADPLQPLVAALLTAHLEFAREVTPPGHVHALDAEGLLGDDVTLFAGWEDGQVVAVGALRELDPAHGEIKSMHTAATQRGRGLGREMLEYLIDQALARGYQRVSLETGTMAAFAPARRLYEERGFERCPPFGQYQPVPNSVCMTLDLNIAEPQ